MKETIYANLEKFVYGTVYQTGYWFPLEILTADIPVEAYDIKKLFDGQIDLLEAVLRACGIETVTEVGLEIGPEGVFEGQNIFELLRERREYEVRDLRLWKPRRRESYYTFPTAQETYYFDESKTWMIYVSHEGTLTVAGAVLVAAAHEIIPDGYVFRGWEPYRKKSVRNGAEP